MKVHCPGHITDLAADPYAITRIPRAAVTLLSTECHKHSFFRTRKPDRFRAIFLSNSDF